MISRFIDALNNRVGFLIKALKASQHRYTNIAHEPIELDGFVSDESSEYTQPGLTFTPDEATSQIGFGKFHIKLMIVLGLVWMVEGMEIFVLSVLAPYLRCQWNLTYFEESLLPILTSLGMILSSPVWGWICDVYGRKKGLYMSAIWLQYFAILSAFSPNYKWLLILRFLVGVGIGAVPQVATILVEYTPAKYRGKSLIFLSLSWSIGFIFAASLSLWLMIDLGFRVLLAAVCIPGFLFLCLFWWIPESFRFYAATNHTRKSLEILCHIANENGTTLPRGTLKVPPPPVKKHGELVELIRGGNYRMTLTLWLIWFIGVMMYYASVYVTTEIFQRYDNDICTEKSSVVTLTCRCKVFTRKDYFDVILASVGEIPGVLISLFLVDSLGRKRSMYILALASLLLQSLLFLCLNRVGATVLLMVIRFAAVGYLNIVIVYTVEVYPTAVRATGMGCANIFGRIGMLLAPVVAQALFHVSVAATKYFLVFSIAIGFLAALSLPFDTTDISFL